MCHVYEYMHVHLVTCVNERFAFFSNALRTFTNISHELIHQALHNKFQKFETIQTMVFDKDGLN